MRIQYSDWLKSVTDRFENTLGPSAIENMSGFTYSLMQEILIEMLQEVSTHNSADQKTITDIYNKIDALSERVSFTMPAESHGYGCPCDKCTHHRAACGGNI